MSLKITLGAILALILAFIITAATLFFMGYRLNSGSVYGNSFGDSSKNVIHTDEYDFYYVEMPTIIMREH